MSYTVKRFSFVNGEVLPPEITFSEFDVIDGETNGSATTPLFTGTDFINYSKDIFEPFIWRMGNYAYHLPPHNPVNGQLWFDTTDNTMKVLTGADYSAVSDDWAPVSTQTLARISQDLIPSQNSTYDLGSPIYRWRDTYTDNIDVKFSVLTRGSEISTSQTPQYELSSLIPTTPYDIVNNSSVAGDTVGDAIDLLANRSTISDVTVVSISQNGGTYQLDPVDNTRYRFTSGTDITVNIDYNAASTTKYFEIVGADLGILTLTSDVEITVNKNSDIVGSTFRFAYFTLGSRDLVSEEWQAIGNFN